MVGHPTGGASYVARNIIKGCAHRHNYFNLQPFKILHDPFFLQRHTKTDQKDIRFGSVDRLNNSFVFRVTRSFVEEAMVRKWNF